MVLAVLALLRELVEQLPADALRLGPIRAVADYFRWWELFPLAEGAEQREGAIMSPVFPLCQERELVPPEMLLRRMFDASRPRPQRPYL